MIKDKAILTRITQEDYSKLEEIAKDQERSMSWIVRKALQQFIEQNESK